MVLAAGLSRRMGEQNKLLLKLPEGKTILRATLEQAVLANAGPVILVTGHQHEAVAREAEGLPVQSVFAPNYTEGLAASLRAGVAAVPVDCMGALVCLGDMPFTPAAMLRTLCTAFAPEMGQDIIQPVFEARPGNPVLWGRRHFAAISALSGDRGARSLLAKNLEALRRVEVETASVLEDIDTREEYEWYFERGKTGKLPVFKGA